MYILYVVQRIFRCYSLSQGCGPPRQALAKAKSLSSAAALAGPELEEHRGLGLEDSEDANEDAETHDDNSHDHQDGP